MECSELAISWLLSIFSSSVERTRYWDGFLGEGKIDSLWDIKTIAWVCEN